MTMDELETKLARRKWDSDVESDSRSDTEPEEDPGSEEEVRIASSNVIESQDDKKVL